MKKITTHASYLRARRLQRLRIVLSQVFLLVGLLGLWELAARVGLIDDFLTSSPSRIWSMLTRLAGEYDLGHHVGVTLTECVLGFAIATVLGTLIAIGLWLSEFLRRVLEPYIIVLNSLPKIALGPLIIVWVGAGTQAILVMTVLICIIITIINMLSAFMSCDPAKILLIRSMGGSQLTVLRKLILPYSLPHLVNTLKINVGLAWVGVIMGEYLCSSAGLGYLIVYGSQVFKFDMVMASTFVLCALAAGMYCLVALVEKLLKKNR